MLMPLAEPVSVQVHYKFMKTWTKYVMLQGDAVVSTLTLPPEHSWIKPEFACSPRVCVGVLQVLLPTDQRHAGQRNW